MFACKLARDLSRQSFDTLPPHTFKPSAHYELLELLCIPCQPDPHSISFWLCCPGSVRLACPAPFSHSLPETQTCSTWQPFHMLLRCDEACLQAQLDPGENHAGSHDRVYTRGGGYVCRQERVDACRHAATSRLLPPPERSVPTASKPMSILIHRAFCCLLCHTSCNTSKHSIDLQLGDQ